MDPANLMVSHSPGSVSDLVSRKEMLKMIKEVSQILLLSTHTHTQESTSTSACAHAYKTK